LGWSKFVSAYVERDKKILKNLILGVWVPTILIENFLCRLAEEFIVDSSWFIEDSSLGKARDLRYAPACAFD